MTEKNMTNAPQYIKDFVERNVCEGAVASTVTPINDETIYSKIYKSDIQPLDCIVQMLTPEEYKGYCKGKALECLLTNQNVQEAAMYFELLRATV